MLHIGVICPEGSSAAIKETIAEHELVYHFHFHIYTKLEEIPDIYENRCGTYDGVLCSGLLPYQYLLENTENILIPCDCINYYEAKFVLSYLLNFTLTCPHIPLNRVYLGFTNDASVLEILPPHLRPYVCSPENYSYETDLACCMGLWQEGKIDMVLTGMANLLDTFKEQNIPYIHVLPTHEIIKESIQRLAQTIVKTKQTQGYKSLGIIKLLYEQDPSPDESEYREITLYKHLVDIKQSLGCSIYIVRLTSRFELLISCNSLSALTEILQEITIQLNQKNEPAFRIGAGASNSFEGSRYLAETALQECTKYSANDAFLCTENGNISGPLSVEDRLTFNIFNDKVTLFSKEKGIDRGNISRILSLYEQDKDKPLSSELLSAYLNITVRSCNRIILQLLEAGLICVQEPPETKAGGKGRPTKYYKFIRNAMDKTFLE